MAKPLGKRELQPSVPAPPPCNYLLLAEVLADAVSTHGSQTVISALAVLARRAGQLQGPDAAVTDALGAWGYRPARGTNGDIELRNCPFEPLARQYPQLVCPLNLQLIQGMLDGIGGPDRAVPVRRAGRCCVVVRRVRDPRKRSLSPRTNPPGQPGRGDDQCR